MRNPVVGLHPALLRVASVLASVLATASCDDVVKPEYVQSQDEAGSLLVSPTNVVAWPQISDSMQPNFALTGDQALLQVVPTTARIQEQVLSAFGLTLSAGRLPSTTTSTTGTNNQNTTTAGTASSTNGTTSTGSTSSGNTGSQTLTSSTSTQPGIAAQATTTAPAGVTSLTLPSAAGGDLGLDPVLKYQTALSLFETVQMLNHEVQNAAVLQGYAPYLVRLKLALMPYRPHLGYSLHARVSFFPTQREDSPDTPLLTELETGPNTSTSNAAEEDLKIDRVPIAIPLLAADNMERALKSRAVEAAQQIGLALATGGIGTTLGANALRQSIDAINSQDLNSRLTITRQSDNTLYVRIGASNEATAGAALVGQTYDIALLLLMPIEYFQQGSKHQNPWVRVITHTQFRRVKDGEVLADRPPEHLVAQIDRVMHQVLAGQPKKKEEWDKLGGEAKENVARRLASPIQEADYEGFKNLLEKSIGDTGFSLPGLKESTTEVLWTAASTILADTAFKSAYFELGWPSDIRISDQTALILDDGKQSSQVLLGGVYAGSANTLDAKLNIVTKGPAVVPGFRSIAAQGVTLNAAAHVLTITFPSLTRWGLNDFDPKEPLNQLVIAQPSCVGATAQFLCPKLRDGKGAAQDHLGFRILHAKAPEETPAKPKKEAGAESPKKSEDDKNKDDSDKKKDKNGAKRKQKSGGE